MVHVNAEFRLFLKILKKLAKSELRGQTCPLILGYGPPQKPTTLPGRVPGKKHLPTWPKSAAGGREREQASKGDTVAKKGQLTPKQAAFVAEYLLDLNATQAAIRAGYSPKTAAFIGAENLKKPNIDAAIQAAQQERARRTEISQDNVLTEIARLAFLDPRRFYAPDGSLVAIPDLPDDVAAAVAGMEVSPEGIRKVKLADKLKALELAARHLGMFRDNLNLTGDIHVLNIHRRPKKAQPEEGA